MLLRFQRVVLYTVPEHFSCDREARFCLSRGQEDQLLHHLLSRGGKETDFYIIYFAGGREAGFYISFLEMLHASPF